MKRYGYDIQLTEEIVVETPWSVVIRFTTKQGCIYLKQTPPDLFIEANVLTALRNECHIEHIPELIESNKALHCFLMKDAGKRLRDMLKQQFDATLLCKAIGRFTSIQLAVTNDVDTLLDIGVPDWRLDKLPDLYSQLLNKKDMLIADGLSTIEISELENLFSKVSNLCEKLSSYSIEPSIVQPDFHDNNILVDDNSQRITIIDLGEIAISHPFFSLVGCLWQIKKHYGLTNEDDSYQQIVDACLSNYSRFTHKAHLLDALATARRLCFIYAAQAQYRLMLACGEENLMSFQRGRLSNTLKEFMLA